LRRTSCRAQAIQQLENLLQASDLAFGFVVMFFKRGAQLVRVGGLRHFRKRLINLLFRVVDVFQRIEKQRIQVFLSHRKLQ
jgi:hypothetical protein